MALDTTGLPNQSNIPSGFTSITAATSAALSVGPFGTVVGSAKVLNGTEGTLSGLMSGNVSIQNYFVAFTKSVAGAWTIQTDGIQLDSTATVALGGLGNAPGILLAIVSRTSGSPAGLPDFSIGTEDASSSNSAVRAIWNLYQKAQAMPSCNASAAVECGLVGLSVTTAP